MNSRSDPLPHRAGFRSSGPISGLIALSTAAARLLVFVLYAVLATLEPFVRVIFFLLALAGFVTCGIYRGLLHDPHFPLGTMLLFSIGLCVLSVAYAGLVRWLSGERR